MSCQSSRETDDKISKLERQIASVNSQIDSLRRGVDSLKAQLHTNKDSNKKFVSNLITALETPTLTIPVFINQRMDQIKKYWETRVSVQYFDEGTFTGSDKKFFSIMYGDIGTPEFSASFDSRGLCESHSTKLDYSDISVMQAKLRNAGFTYASGCNCWTKSGQNMSWSIVESFGQHYTLECTRK